MGPPPIDPGQLCSDLRRRLTAAGGVLSGVGHSRAECVEVQCASNPMKPGIVFTARFADGRQRRATLASRAPTAEELERLAGGLAHG